MRIKFNPRVAYTFLSALIIITGTIAAIQYAKGNYRFTNKGFVKETGLLSANSFPTGAQVFIDDRLVTATDDTLYLEPGVYDVKISKDGFAPWQKTMTIEKELVAQTNALLFPSAPSLSPLSFTGVQNISPSADGQKILYYTASASASTENGLYVLELGNNLLSLQRGPKQIAEDVPGWDLATANFIWSPDSNEVLAITSGHQVLLSVDKKQDLRTLADVGIRTRQILSTWEEEIYLRERQALAEFPPEIIAYATQSARNVYISPDKKRLMYTAAADFVIDDDIVPPVPATNTQPEQRTLEPDGIYIYDREEDKNFRIDTEPTAGQLPHPTKHLLAIDLDQKEPLTLESSPSAFTTLQASTSAETTDLFRTQYASHYSNSYQWFPDSRHLIHTSLNEIKIIGYDATNDTVVYSGPFAQDFVYPWPDGGKLIILTSFSPKSPLNLYAIELK